MTYLLVTTALVFGSIQVEIETLDGRKASGALAEWTAEAVVVAADSGAQVFPVRTLLAVRPLASPPARAADAGIRVELGDGSVLRASRYTVAAGTAAIVVAGGTSIEIPTTAIAAVHLQEPDDAIAAQWEEIRELNVAGDVLVLRKETSVDYLEGVLGDITDETVHFRTDGQGIPVPRNKVDGILYYRHNHTEFAEPLCRLLGRDGTEINVRSVSVVDHAFHVVGSVDFQWTLPEGLIDQFDFSLGKVEYLSDLTPESSHWTPFFGLPARTQSLRPFGTPRRDAALEGGHLRLGGKEYAKGLALRSRSELTYRLPGRFRLLSAVAGIDDRMAGRGHVRLVIRGDDRTLFDQAVAGGGAPCPLQIDITGVRQITILVDYGDDLDLADHLDLCDARVSK